MAAVPNHLGFLVSTPLLHRQRLGARSGFRALSAFTFHNAMPYSPTHPYASFLSCGTASRRVTTAVHSVDYSQLEGIDNMDITLPDAVIYGSLRRKAERMCVDSALAVFKELAGARNGVSTPEELKPCPALGPRDVVQGILAAMRDDPMSGGAVVVQFASDTNRFSRCTPQTLTQWLSTSDFKYLLNISSFFVSPAPTYNKGNTHCTVSCVVHSRDNTRHALSFIVSKVEESGKWMIDSVTSG